jgi:hypothetical protein
MSTIVIAGAVHNTAEQGKLSKLADFDENQQGSLRGFAAGLGA